MTYTTDEMAQLDRAGEKRVHLDAFIAAHPECLAAAIQRATVYRARVGLRRAFSTSAQAVAYERGWNEFPNQPPGLPHGPRMDGYRDADQALSDQLSVAQERRAEIRAEEWADQLVDDRREHDARGE